MGTLSFFVTLTNKELSKKQNRIHELTSMGHALVKPTLMMHQPKSVEILTVAAKCG
jgi:hypothetical protein